MPNNYTFLIVASIATAFACYYMWKKSKENYAITLGMLAPQNYFYAKCTNDCVRDKTGDSSTGQFLWLCTDKCAEIAKAREVQGVPDLTKEEYQRYTVYDSNLQLNSMWDSEYLESSYCMNDVAKWCEQQYCPFSTHPWCMKDCIKMKGVDCGGAVVGGWKP